MLINSFLFEIKKYSSSCSQSYPSRSANISISSQTKACIPSKFNRATDIKKPLPNLLNKFQLNLDQPAASELEPWCKQNSQSSPTDDQIIVLANDAAFPITDYLIFANSSVQ